MILHFWQVSPVLLTFLQVYSSYPNCYYVRVCPLHPSVALESFCHIHCHAPKVFGTVDMEKVSR